jgi:hypothetical protein
MINTTIFKPLILVMIIFLGSIQLVEASRKTKEERQAAKQVKKAEKAEAAQKRCEQQIAQGKPKKWNGKRCINDRAAKKEAKAEAAQKRCEQQIAQGKPKKWNGKRCVNDKAAKKEAKADRKKEKCEQQIKAGKNKKWDEARNRCVNDKDAKKANKFCNTVLKAMDNGAEKKSAWLEATSNGTCTQAMAKEASCLAKGKNWVEVKGKYRCVNDKRAINSQASALGLELDKKTINSCRRNLRSLRNAEVYITSEQALQKWIQKGCIVPALN